MRKISTLFVCFLMLASTMYAQNSKLTKEAVLSMSIEQLSDLPLEDLMYAVELLDVKSVDELFELIMNKNVSSASKKEEDSFKSPLSSSVITKEEMRTYGVTSIEEAFRLIPGVIVREKTNGEYDVHLRGLDNIPDGHMFLYTENTNTLLMINSRPVFNYCQGAPMWETLPVSIEDVSRIEVVRGPSGALYGSNAITGVINIITEKATSDSKLISGSISSGSQNTYIGDVAIRKAFNNKWAASLSGNFQSRQRNRDELYLMPNADIYDPLDATKDFSNGAWLDKSAIGKLMIHTSLGDHPLIEPETPMESAFPDPSKARRNIGVNGSVSYSPSTDIYFDLTGGYQNSFANTTPVGDDYFSYNGRQSKTMYVDLTSSIKDIKAQLNYMDGCQNFNYGTPSFKIRNQQFNGNVEYDWQLLENLNIRPGFNYQWTRVGDDDYNDYWYTDEEGNTKQLSSYLNGNADLSMFAVSLRGDYTAFEKLRIIAALRAEKLDIPNKWYPSWQFAATYAINDNNTVRAVYSRANRSSIITNTSSNYKWERTQLGWPNTITFLGNEDADVMSCDNIEIGYRLRPSKNILIDAEAFYSMSSDYGALMSVNTKLTSSQESLMKAISTLLPIMGTATPDQLIGMAFPYINADSKIQYNNLPYDVKQMGASVNIDWIISKKLIAKFHGSIQKTTIDNYYQYSQSNAIASQLTNSLGNLVGVTTELAVNVGKYGQSYLGDAMHYADINAYKPIFDAMSPEEQAATLEALNTKGNEAYNPAMYYAVKYDVRLDKNGVYSTGNSEYVAPASVNDHKHKHTPAYYGMVGLIYNPITELSLSGYGYFYGKQETTTTYGTATVDPKFIMNLKVGYKPVPEFELFFNARNLFNDNRKEFVYCDNIGGIYSFGVNFGF